ncbi:MULTISPECIES: CaiB/BaiF CoA transferase family protein [Herbaspirillum]|jgi:crotonobetainyl-CoA:carnitine CoA-transferase CaiB-like acyl-CoA transferase|uniref:CaiB/BaiF CoA transferase family protein n=1 Tax=Herbaspirillum TaxID=963 RepID=UPI00034AF078|nr:MULTISPECIES: CaiB/BaiF CoA-transferase family protein [Herbaspirillum]MCP1572952.1 crotonobetainyl-CoA:carnitine CoA-transferase CaiB-like acyl-CoA transferase [Herbaspirillum rubrisubalbicans]NQE47282.1 CoA-transferase [Herbaspirillum rubrisubalbicans]
MATNPLSQIRVIDMSRVLAGPWAAQMLGDLGAEVIKVERPGKGDDSRQFGPPFLQDREGRDTRESSFYISTNRNKKSITCDIAKPEGQALIRSLVAHCDILVENYKVGDLKRYGLDYESLRAVNPALIYCSVTGFGQTGPYSPRPGYDSIFQGMGGLMSVTGNPDDVPGGGPMKTGPSLADIICGQYASYAILAALYHRDANGGEGQYIDMSLLDSLIASTSHYASQYLVSGDVPVRRGTEGNGGMPSRLFHCLDGDIMLVAGNNEQYRRFCEVLGYPELATDPRFAENINRVMNRRALAAVFEPLVAQWKMHDLLTALDAAGVPAGPINNLEQAFADPHVQARQMCVEVEHPLSEHKVKMVANPVKFSGTPITAYAPPPMLGQHTDAVLGELLGMSSADVAALRERKVI